MTSPLNEKALEAAMNEKIERPKWMRPGGLLPIDPFGAAQRDDDLARLHDALDARVSSLTERVAALEADTKYDDLGQSVRWLNARIDGIENGSIPIAPPEPASQKDDLPPICSNSTCPNYGSSCFEACPDWPEASSPTSLDALKERAAGFTPTEREHLRLCALLDEAYALDRAEKPQGETAQGVRERVVSVMLRDELDGADGRAVAQALYDAGLLASQPQRVTVNWNAALDLLYAHGRGPGKSMSDGMLAVLKSIPGIVIEGA